MLAAIAWSDLLQVVWVSLLAGIGVTASFSLVILGSARAAESRRAGNGAAAAAFAVLSGVALLAFVAGLVFGLLIILNK